MAVAALPWRFHASIPNERANRLLRYADFQSIATLLDQSIIEDFTWEPPTGLVPRGCQRAVFLIRVIPETYDAFFNSPAGYRGQYAVSPKVGEAANRRLLDRLEPRLLAFAATRLTGSNADVRTSLRAAQAKIWICEHEVELHLGIDQPEIAYAPWEQSSSTEVGLRAPVGSRLEVKGGWLEQNGDEYINPHKVGRSEDIHCTGFS